MLAGSAIGLLAAVVSDHSLAAALAGGGGVVAVLGALVRYERFAWKHSATAPLAQT